MKKLATSLVLLLSLLHGPLYAQRETQNWLFGNNAGLSFLGGTPAFVSGSAMLTYEAAATVSDPAGNLLFYTNSVNVWNRNHQLMTNGQVLGGHESASQGAVIVRNPANAAQYYLFVVDGCDNQLVGGLKYSIVDMTPQSGLGSVVSKANQLSTVSLTEKLTAVRHANGRDTWIVVHAMPTAAGSFWATRIRPPSTGTWLLPVLPTCSTPCTCSSRRGSMTATTTATSTVWAPPATWRRGRAFSCAWPAWAPRAA